MTPVSTVEVRGDEAGQRLDRWFRRRFPDLTQGRLQKLLRTGQIRVDGGRARASQRLEVGQRIRVPPLGAAPAGAKARRDRPTADPDDVAALREAVLHLDDDVLVLNKPPGLAVQGGTKTARHIDAMLDGLRLGAPERPRLVHRLDKDTSGVLVLARNAGAASRLGAVFRSREAVKIYWALLKGVPGLRKGKIELSLAKLPGRAGERMVPVGAEDQDGKRAVTRYLVVDAAGREVSWAALWPLTGRTHQLRVHAASLGTPILGDGKYGGADAFVQGMGLSRKLHLHARRLALPHPRAGVVDVSAPLPPHMAAAWRFFGFDESAADDPFSDDD